MTSNKSILVLTTTYPLHNDDYSSIFVKTLCEKIVNTSSFSLTVLAADAPDTIKYTSPNTELEVKRYQYWIKKYQKLAYGDAILSNLKKNRLLYFQIVPFIASLFLHTVKEVVRVKPAVIHAHWVFPTGWCAVVVGKFFHIPTLVTVHGSDMNRLIQGRVGRYILRKVFGGAQLINVVSDRMRGDIQKYFDENIQKKVWVQQMGVDEKVFVRVEKAKEKLGLQEKKVILYVGRLSEEKGLEYLIQAIPHILKKVTNCSVLIVGDGNKREELEHLAKRLKIQESILFIGSVPHKQLPLYYSAADVLVLPSLHEGFPVVVMEGLLMGCRIVLTDAAWNLKIQPPETVRIVPTSHEALLVQAIIQSLLDDGAFYRTKSEIQQYGVSSVAHNFCRKYKELIMIS